MAQVFDSLMRECAAAMIGGACFTGFLSQTLLDEVQKKRHQWIAPPYEFASARPRQFNEYSTFCNCLVCSLMSASSANI